MAEGLQKLVENLQVEINNLRSKVTSSRPTAPKDLSLISLIPRWSGTEKSVSVKEFFELVELSVRIGCWGEFDRIQITILKLSDVARIFYSSNLELQKADISWENFKAKFLHRFRDVKSGPYHFVHLQTCRREKYEPPRILGSVFFTGHENSP